MPTDTETVVKIAERRPDTVYECDCGCQTFYINGSRFKGQPTLQCQDCGTFIRNFVLMEQASMQEYGE